MVSIRDGFSLSSPSGRLHAQILASVAEYEDEVRSERIRAGVAAAHAKGKHWGGSEKGCYYRVTPEQVKAITQMIARGEGVTAVARITGLNRPTIYRVPGNVRGTRT